MTRYLTRTAREPDSLLPGAPKHIGINPLQASRLLDGYLMPANLGPRRRVRRL